MYGGDAKWVVVLEAATGIDDWSLDRLVQVLADLSAVALHCPDRYAVQMEVLAGSQAAALFVAESRLHSALAKSGLPTTELVRSEVLSQEEFERDCRLAYGDGPMPTIGATENQMRTS